MIGIKRSKKITEEEKERFRLGVFAVLALKFFEETEPEAAKKLPPEKRLERKMFLLSLAIDENKEFTEEEKRGVKEILYRHCVLGEKIPLPKLTGGMEGN